MKFSQVVARVKTHVGFQSKVNEKLPVMNQASYYNPIGSSQDENTHSLEGNIEAEEYELNIIFELAKDQRFDVSERLDAIERKISEGRKDSVWVTLAKDKGLVADFRLEAAEKISLDELRCSVLMHLALEKSLCFYHRLEAATRIFVDEKRDNLLVMLAEDQSLHFSDRRCVTDRVSSEETRGNLLQALEQAEKELKTKELLDALLQALLPRGKVKMDPHWCDNQTTIAKKEKKERKEKVLEELVRNPRIP